MKRNVTTSTLSWAADGAAAAILATKLETADTLLTRTKGLLGRRELPAGEGLWIKRCNSIHTCFMRFPIDAIFVDDRLKVISVYQQLKPWRITWMHMKARSVFELPAGTLNARDIKVGDVLKVDNVGDLQKVDEGGSHVR